MLEIIILTIILVSIGVCGQLIIKNGMNQVGEIHLQFSNITDSFWEIVRIFQEPKVWIGLTLSGIAAIFWLIILSKANLSFAYPLAGGIFYIALMITSWLWLGEKITFFQLTGTIIIIIGIIAITHK